MINYDLDILFFSKHKLWKLERILEVTNLDKEKFYRILEEFNQKFENQGIEKGKLNTLKELLKVKLGTLSSPLEKQLTNTSLEKLNVLTLNIFNINSEEDVLKIIH